VAESLSCTVREAQDRMSQQEFLDLLTFWETSPPLADHLNVLMANVCTTVANSTPGRKKALRIKDFIIEYKKEMPSKEARLQKLKNFFDGHVKKNG
jgi:hypothetical protein